MPLVEKYEEDHLKITHNPTILDKYGLLALWFVLTNLKSSPIYNFISIFLLMSYHRNFPVSLRILQNIIF